MALWTWTQLFWPVILSARFPRFETSASLENFGVRSGVVFRAGTRVAKSAEQSLILPGHDFMVHSDFRARASSRISE